jgi:hypothetical protein
MRMIRLVLRPEVRREAEDAALEAAFKANDETELSYHAEELITAAVRAALVVIEERMA